MNPNQLSGLYLAKLSKASQVEILGNNIFFLPTALWSKDSVIENTSRTFKLTDVYFP